MRVLRFYLVSVGQYYFLQGKYDKALPNFLRGLKYHKQFNDRNQVMGTLVKLAKIYDSVHDYVSAFKYAHEALATALQTGARQFIRDCYQILYSVYDHWRQTDSALSYHEKYVAIKDSITSAQVAAKLVAYSFDQKIELLNIAKEIQEVELQNQSLLRNILIGSIIALLLLAAIVIRNITLKRKNEKQSLEHQQLESKIESQQALLNERLRISRELHDDIGSTLGSISIYSEVAKKRTEKNENTSEVLSKIAFTSRELIDKMSDIVWSLNLNNGSFEQLQNRMATFAAMILAPRNITHNFVADEELKKNKFTGGQLKNIFLIFKEALYNIVKYADCKTVRTNLFVQSNNLIMTIQDDGRGFDVSQSTSDQIFSSEKNLGGNGIKNMNARAEDMNAKLCISSKVNEGTTVQLELHL